MSLIRQLGSIPAQMGGVHFIRCGYFLLLSPMTRISVTVCFSSLQDEVN